MKILSLLIALLLVNVLLLAPQWLLAGSPGPTWIALEACLVVGLFAWLPRGRWSAVLAGVTALVLVLVSFLAFADATARQSLGRPLYLYLDLHLLRAVYNLMTGTLGSAMAGLVVLGLVLGASVLAWVLAYLLSPVEIHKRGWFARAVGVALIVFFCMALLTSDTMPGPTQRMTLPAVQITMDQARHIFRILNERERFAAELAALPAGYASLPDPLLQLQDRDVLLAFIESYGVSALYDLAICVGHSCPGWTSWPSAWMTPACIWPPARWWRRSRAASPGWRVMSLISGMLGWTISCDMTCSWRAAARPSLTTSVGPDIARSP